jgi:hypothetical protein
VREKPLPSSTPQALVLALVLTLCAASGLAAGMTTRALAGSALTANFVPRTAATQTRSPAGSISVASPTAAAIATIVPPAGFSVHADVQPRTVAAGQPFTIVATVVSADGAPLAGVACYMRAAPDSPPLLPTWPDAAVTDATGTATWNLTAPAASPGVYTFDIVAYGAHYQADWRPSLTLAA